MLFGFSAPPRNYEYELAGSVQCTAYWGWMALWLKVAFLGYDGISWLQLKAAFLTTHEPTINTASIFHLVISISPKPENNASILTYC
jgi:hypothetical protein